MRPLRDTPTGERSVDAPFILRRARPDDVEGVHAVHTASIEVGAAGHYLPEVVQAWVGAFNRDRFPENIRRMEFYVAELQDGRVGGFVALDPKASEVESIYVAPWVHGLGLGSYLLGFVEEVARTLGLTHLWLDSSLNAVGFYSRYGWAEAERHARTRDGIEIPLVRMEKEL
jgi:GNAT superfamily N-acetyltransferase